MLERAGGWAGLGVALWFPVFGLCFAIIVPLTGFDIQRLGDPAYALPELRDRAALIRFLGVGNGASMLAAAVFAVVVALCAAPAARAPAVWGGTLAALGWAVYFLGEISDQVAYVALPFVETVSDEHRADARTAYVGLQGLGRMAHAWGYGVIGAGTLGLAHALRQALPAASGACRVGMVSGVLGVVFFLVEYLYVSTTGDAGAGGFWVFGAVFGAWGTTTVLWHGWAGLCLLRWESGGG